MAFYRTLFVISSTGLAPLEMLKLSSQEKKKVVIVVCALSICASRLPRLKIDRQRNKTKKETKEKVKYI